MLQFALPDLNAFRGVWHEHPAVIEFIAIRAIVTFSFVPFLFSDHLSQRLFSGKASALLLIVPPFLWVAMMYTLVDELQYSIKVPRVPRRAVSLLSGFTVPYIVMISLIVEGALFRGYLLDALPVSLGLVSLLIVQLGMAGCWLRVVMRSRWRIAMPLVALFVASLGLIYHANVLHTFRTHEKDLWAARESVESFLRQSAIAPLSVVCASASVPKNGQVGIQGTALWTATTDKGPFLLRTEWTRCNGGEFRSSVSLE